MARQLMMPEEPIFSSVVSVQKLIRAGEPVVKVKEYTVRKGVLIS